MLLFSISNYIMPPESDFSSNRTFARRPLPAFPTKSSYLNDKVKVWFELESRIFHFVVFHGTYGDKQ